MLQVYDRVLPSHSVPTMIGFAVLAAAMFTFQGILDAVRGRMLVAPVGPRASIGGSHHRPGHEPGETLMLIVPDHDVLSVGLPSRRQSWRGSRVLRSFRACRSRPSPHPDGDPHRALLLPQAT